MTDPATVFADRLSAVRQSMADFEVRWRAWAALQPVNQVCHRHAQVRPRLEQTSLERSWQKKDFIMIYKWCPECKKEKQK